MKKSEITQIVEELIELEPTLAQHKDTLKKNIAAILSAKPDTKFTESFKKKLLVDLQKNMHVAHVPLPSSPLETMRKFLYAIGGAAVASLALYVAVIHPISPDSDGTYIPPSSVAMERVMQNGEMQMPMADGLEDSAMDGNMNPNGIPSPRPQSGGGGGMMDSKMIAPGEPYGYTAVEYVYEGDIPLPEDTQVTAFKRTPLNASQKADLLSNTFVSGMLNVSALKSLNVSNITLSESGDEPLMVNVDFKDGTISINRQIDYSLQPQSQCRDESCYERYRLKESDMLSDDRIMDIAESFLDKLGVEKSSYGEPTVADNWRMRYEIQSDKTNFYFPEQTTVIFPYLVQGIPVYDAWGNASGLSVTVDMRLRAATGLWGLRTMSLSEKKYDAVQDVALIKSALQMGNMYGYPSENTETVTAKLGEPKMVFMMHSYWDSNAQIGYEEYVPALAFPVQTMPEGTYEYRKAVVVSLAKELLEDKRDMPVPLPMPVEPMMDPPIGIPEPEVMPMEMMER